MHTAVGVQKHLPVVSRYPMHLLWPETPLIIASRTLRHTHRLLPLLCTARGLPPLAAAAHGGVRLAQRKGSIASGQRLSWSDALGAVRRRRGREIEADDHHRRVTRIGLHGEA